MMLAVFVAIRTYVLTIEVPTEDGTIAEVTLILQHVFTLTPVAVFFGVARNLQGYLFNFWQERPESVDYEIKQYYTTWLKFEAGVLLAVPIIEAFAPAIPNIAIVVGCVLFVVDIVRSYFNQLMKPKPSTAA